jgi:hyperosmotically inducible protein
MPNPLDTLTKPLQLGLRIAFGAVQLGQQILQGLTGGDHRDEPRPRPQAQPQEQPPEQRSQAQRSERPKPLDDTTITRKVESVLFRDDSIDKGKINVNTADGVVWLRGEAHTPEQIKQLEAQAREIPEVKQVENLLHLPKTPAPTRADTPRTQQKTRRTKGTAAARKAAPKRTSSERKTSRASAEPTPKKLAKSRKGRQPAPLGSSGGGPNGGSAGS